MPEQLNTRLQSYDGRCGLEPLPKGAMALPEPTGKHCVGKMRLRLAAGAATPEQAQPLPLTLWHPVRPQVQAKRAGYLDPKLPLQLIASLERPWRVPLEGALRIKTRALADVPPDLAQSWPVILFSPGYGFNVDLYSSLLEELASHGFVVVGIDHPLVSMAVATDDGSVIPAAERPSSEAEQLSLFGWLHEGMVGNQARVLDWLESANTSHFGGRLSLQKIAALGHSIGGSAALQGGRQDPRIKTSAIMDGRVWGETRQPWPHPVLVLLSGDPADPSLNEVATLNPAHKSVDLLLGAGHNDFSDFRRLIQASPMSASAQELAQMSLGTVDHGMLIGQMRSSLLRQLKQQLSP
ncbi:alpha/beta hydrolase family protein [Paucibacter sp. XJ19-41]|uniref:alpha/beta hydrolase family protein n=1 Tax=Paucibacter sp. XJ19-41 TaxID=2927824 RepID=UPI0023498CC0|nr:hypothetical protein [Paucibacter sp. XJ19-41]MDC6170750.1 hypothetical protein [Paucibacter sp. XJ19-41]